APGASGKGEAGGYGAENIREALENLRVHLDFHRALVEDDPERVERYLSALSKMEAGLHTQITDPAERMAFMVLDVVVRENLDPWDIDLARFARGYRRRLKKADAVDFITAGRLVLLAWTILERKTRSLRDRAEETRNLGLQEDGGGGDVLAYEPPPWDILYDDNPVFSPSDVLLEPRVMREERRRVDLVDLMDAFEEARREAALQEEIVRIRRRLRENRVRRPDVSGKIHQETLEDDIRRVWTAVSSINKEEITFEDLFIPTREDMVSVFVALLFLAKDGKISVRQRGFPRGRISIKVLVPYEEREGLRNMDIGESAEKEDSDEGPVMEREIVAV
ncbi:MAG: hypothetical protein J7L61_00485, partial [Thermoplasmata archaeon]|nr:hypothetical protein [Thermoplasmata archaeon]